MFLTDFPTAAPPSVHSLNDVHTVRVCYQNRPSGCSYSKVHCRALLRLKQAYDTDCRQWQDLRTQITGQCVQHDIGVIRAEDRLHWPGNVENSFSSPSLL